MPGQSLGQMLPLLIIVVVMMVMMWFQSRKSKQQQQERKDFRANLQPGTEVITIGRVIGKVVSVDTEYEEIVIDSEGSKMRFALDAIAREYVRPAFIHDDEVDENGNPLPEQSDDQAQVPVDEAEDVNDGDSSQNASDSERDEKTK